MTLEPPSLLCSLASDPSPPTRILIVAVEPRLSDVLFVFLDGRNTWGQIHKGTGVTQPCSTELLGTRLPHITHTAPVQDFVAWSQHHHLSPKGACCAERTKPTSDATRGAQMQEHAGSFLWNQLIHLYPWGFNIFWVVTGREYKQKVLKDVVQLSKITTSFAGSWDALEARQAVSTPVEINTPTK